MLESLQMEASDDGQLLHHQSFGRFLQQHTQRYVINLNVETGYLSEEPHACNGYTA